MMPVVNDNANNAIPGTRPIESFVPTRRDCFAAAIQFLTRVLVPGMPPMSADRYEIALRRGVICFPLVGGFIGIFTAVIFLGLGWGLSAWVAALIAIGCEALLTGAFHEDAFADTCDALGGGWTQDQALEIMKDSRLGTYGTLALVIGVGIRVACFAELAGHGWPWAIASIIAASTFGRVAIIGMMLTTKPIADRKSQARDISGTQSWQTFVIALAMALPLWFSWFCLSPMKAVLTVLAVIVLLAWYRQCILSRVGGTTGDLLGCSAYLTQLAILVGSSWSP